MPNNELSINEFTTHLRNENWESENNRHGLHLKFVTLLNIFRIFEASSPTNTDKMYLKRMTN
jgi:hypothetical protein